VTNTVVLAHKDTEVGTASVTRFANVEEAAKALTADVDTVVLVSDGCLGELRAELATLVARLDCRVVEVQGEPAAPHGNPLSAACAGVISGFGVAAGVSAALAALRS